MQFISGVGARLNGADSRITYQFDQPLQTGEFSLMVTGIASLAHIPLTLVLVHPVGLGIA